MIQRSHTVARALGSTVLYGFLLAILLAVMASVATAQATPRSFSVDKYAEKSTYCVGDVIKYTVKITNTGTAAIARPLVSIYDPMAETTPRYTADTDFPLHTGDVAKAVYYYTVKPTDAGCEVKNTVTVTVRGLTPKTATETVTIQGIKPKAEIEIEKCAEVISADKVKYTITIENEGDIILRKVRVLDTLLGNITEDFFPTGTPRVLCPGDEITRTITYSVKCDDPDPLINTATVSAEIDNIRKRIEDSDTVSTPLCPPTNGLGAADIYLYDACYANPVGKNIQNTTGVGQIQYVSTCAGTAITLPIRVVNTTGKTVNLRVKGDCGDSNWTVAYVNAKNGGSSITSLVTGSRGWNPSCNNCEMKPGDARDFIVTITPRSGMRSGINTKVCISLIVEGTTKTDVVVADVTVR